MTNYRENPDDHFFFDRMPVRSISYSIDWDDQKADYQINKKMDPETGKPVLHVLDTSSMAIDYLATQNYLNRPVVLKVLRKDRQNDIWTRQFVHGAEITAKLDHPNITPVHELGRSLDGTFFYSMKYVQGTLGKYDPI